METGKALSMAQEKGLDLVEINPTSRPPICKIMDFGKYKYDLSKKQKEQKSRQKVIELKEVRLTLKISDHDLSYKAKQAREFFDKGDKVRVSLRLRGRENVFYTQAFQVFEKFSDYAGLEFERYPFKGGNMITATVSKIKAKEEDAQAKDTQSNGQESKS
jgi:translation initiation factor IF-3